MRSFASLRMTTILVGIVIVLCLLFIATIQGASAANIIVGPGSTFDPGDTEKGTILPRESGEAGSLGYCMKTGNCTICNVFEVAANIIQWILGTVGALALLFLIWGGFTWLTSAGNTEKIQAGKKQITGAIFGMLIVLGAWFLINAVIGIFVAPAIGDLGKAEKAAATASVSKIFTTDAKDWATIICGE